MRLHNRALVAVILSLAGFYSCSRQATIPTQLTYTPVPVFTIPDSLLATSPIEYAFFIKRSPSNSSNRNQKSGILFNRIEKTMVGYADDQFFRPPARIGIRPGRPGRGCFCFSPARRKGIIPYGRRNGRNHTGIDLKINRRDTVLAAFDGIVRMTGGSRGYGNVVVVRHYNGLETVYAHNSKHLVRSGDHVKAGTPVSITGETGRATTDHVHFEIRVNGKTIDPAFGDRFQHPNPSAQTPGIYSYPERKKNSGRGGVKTSGPGYRISLYIQN